MRTTDNEVHLSGESDQKPSFGSIDPVCSPASLFPGGMAGSDCDGERGLNQDPTAFCSEGGYHTFSEASLDPQFSQDMAALHIDNNRGHNSNCSWGFTGCEAGGSSARGRSGATAISGDDQRGGDHSAVPVGAAPETFPLSGGGYSAFSSASFVSSGSSSSMPKPPVTPLTTKGLGGDRSDQRASMSPAGGGGNGDDGGGGGGSGRESCVPRSTSSELENRLDGMKVALENGDARRNGSPTPLSPDALTPFSRGDPEAKERDR